MQSIFTFFLQLQFKSPPVYPTMSQGPAQASYLSSSKYGYDFVVSTTQASINSDLLAFLDQEDMPELYLCFLADPTTGDPTEQISLDDLKTQTGGIDPFQIPADTPYNDDQITALTQARFIIGIRIQMGLPRNVEPKSLQPVTLGDDARRVGFRMYCRELDVIQNTPANGWGSTGAWNVWSQPSDEAWSLETEVNLVTQDLDKDLDTPYLNNNPDLKAQLESQLENLSGTAFSLQ